MTPEERAAYKAKLQAKLEGGATAADGAPKSRLSEGQRELGQLAHAVGGSALSETVLPYMSQGLTAAENWLTGSDKKPITADEFAAGREQERASQSMPVNMAIEGTGQIAGMLPFMKGMKMLGIGGKSLMGLMGLGAGAGVGKELATNVVPDLLTGAEKPGWQILTDPLKEGALEAGGGAAGKLAARFIAPAVTGLQSYAGQLAKPVLDRALELVKTAAERGVKLNADEAALQAAKELGDTATEGQVRTLQQKLSSDLSKTGLAPKREAANQARTEVLDPLAREARAKESLILGSKPARAEDVLKQRVGIHPEAEKLRMDLTRGQIDLGGARADSATALEATRDELQRRLLQTAVPSEQQIIQQQLKSLDDVLAREAPTRATSYPHRTEAKQVERLQSAGDTQLPPPLVKPEGSGAKALFDAIPSFVKRGVGVGGVGSSIGGAVGGLAGPVGAGIGAGVGAIPGLVAGADRALADRAVPLIADMSMNKADEFLSLLGRPAGTGELAGAAGAAEVGRGVGPEAGGMIPDLNLRGLLETETPEERIRRRSKNRGSR